MSNMDDHIKRRKFPGRQVDEYDSILQDELDQFASRYSDELRYIPWRISADDIRIVFSNIRKKVLGQREAINQIEDAFLTNTVRPISDKGCAGVFLLWWPSWTGKAFLFEEITNEINTLNESRWGKTKTTFYKIPFSDGCLIEPVSIVGGIAPWFLGSDQENLFSVIAKSNKINDGVYRSCLVFLHRYNEYDRAKSCNDDFSMDVLADIFENALFSVRSSNFEVLDLRNTIFVLDYPSSVIPEKAVIRNPNSNKTSASAGDRRHAADTPAIAPENTIDNENTIDKASIERDIQEHFSPHFMRSVDKVIIFEPPSEEMLKEYIWREYRRMCLRIRKIYKDVIKLPPVEKYMDMILLAWQGKPDGFKMIRKFIHGELTASFIRKYAYDTSDYSQRNVLLKKKEGKKRKWF